MKPDYRPLFIVGATAILAGVLVEPSVRTWPGSFVSGLLVGIGMVCLVTGLVMSGRKSRRGG